MDYRDAYRWAAFWIVFCVWCQCVPWILSACGQLNQTGYLVAVSLSLPAVVWGLGKMGGCSLLDFRGMLSRWKRRLFRQPVFGIWLVLFGAALVGGMLYPPTNHDGLTYRFPRILHWFWEGEWHWIENPAESQMNLSTHGFEWLMGFLFALTGSDRFFFLVNVISFLLLPGLMFAFLTRLGVSGRVAAWWMWIFPTGYGVALQAGSIGNDLFAIPYVLAGMVFALRARESKAIGDVVLAILAAALVTGTKLSNAPLVLPIGVALMGNFSWVLRWRHAPALVAATITGLIASAAPVMMACMLHTGHFSGDPDNSMGLNIDNPVAGMVANTLQAAGRNLMPPVNPGSGWWNAHYEDWLPGSLTIFLHQEYPRFHLQWSELPQEENDGLGLGLTVLVLAAIGAAAMGFFRRREKRIVTAERQEIWWISVGIGAAALVYFVKMGSEAGPRLLLPYYAVVLALFLVFDANRQLVRQRWWRVAATIAALCAVPAVVLSPNRPLLPVRTMIAMLPESVREKGAIQRISSVYEVYSVRNDAMAPLRSWLPPGFSGSGRVGFIGDGRSLRTGLWRPFGSRKIEMIHSELNSERVRNGEFQVIVADLSFLGTEPPEQWAAARGLRLISTETVSNYAGKPAERYAVLLPAVENLTAAESKQ